MSGPDCSARGRLYEPFTDPSRRTFILAGAAGGLAATLSLVHAQPATDNINFRVTDTQSPSVIFVAGLVLVDGSILGGEPESVVKRAKERAHAGIQLLTQSLFNDIFGEGSDPAVRERMVARAKKVEPLLREELFVDMVRWDLTQARDALKQTVVHRPIQIASVAPPCAGESTFARLPSSVRLA